MTPPPSWASAQGSEARPRLRELQHIQDQHSDFTSADVKPSNK